jgi:hypothetical protein
VSSSFILYHSGIFGQKKTEIMPFLLQMALQELKAFTAQTASITGRETAAKRKGAAVFRSVLMLWFVCGSSTIDLVLSWQYD